MSRDGSGTYSLPAGSTVTTLTTIESAPYNAVLADLEADANVDRPIAAGGTGASTAAGARANLGVRALKAIDTAGSSNAYTYTSTDSLTPSDGDAIIIIANFSNTGAATIDVDSTGAVAIKKMVSGTATALASGDIQSGHHYLLTYDSGETAWLLQGATTLDGYTIDSADNTLTVDLSEATVTGTMSEFNTACSDETFTTLGKIGGINAQTGTTYTAALSDIGKLITMSNASANTLTIPTNASVAFATGSWFAFAQKGAGTTTVTGDTGVTVNGVSAGGVDLPARYLFFTVLKVGTDEWYVNIDGVA